MGSESNYPKVLIISEQGAEPTVAKVCSSYLKFGAKYLQKQ